MSPVDESLKSTRQVHHMLMLVCATMLAVALSPSEEKDYSGAIAEIDAIRRIDLAQFARESVEETNRLAKESGFAIEWAAGFCLLMRYELDKIGLSLEESDSRIFAFCAAFDVERVRALRRTRLIKDYEDFLIENIGIHSVDFGAARVAEAFAVRIRDPNILKPDFLPGTKLALMVFNMMPPSFAPSRTRNLSTQMSVAFQFAELQRPPVEVTIAAPNVWALGTFDGTRFQDWLAKQRLLDGLVEGRMLDGQYYTSESVFPRLRPVWSLVADKVPEEAKRVLLEEVEKSRRTISFFGVGIETSMVVFAAPSLAVVLLLYLLSHAGHLQRICQTDTESFSTFPWLPLFPDRTSRTVSFASILLLPLVTFGWLLIRFRHIAALSLCVAVVLTVGAVASAYLSWRRISAVRDTWYKRNEAETVSKQE